MPAYVSGIPGSLEQRRVGGKSVRRGPKASRQKVFPIIILHFQHDWRPKFFFPKKLYIEPF